MKPIFAGLRIAFSWIVSLLAVLPFAIYFRYIDLGEALGPEFEGVGICYYRLERYLQLFVRILFIVTFCLPLAIAASFLVKTSTVASQSEERTRLQ